ncbi:exodeoxyribonuclease VII small subunit [Chlamydiota bacterium]
MEQEFNFERSFSRLEEILEKMNSGNVSLDESLKLYEEADRLITGCTHKLNRAEAKIEMLIKKRDGELELDTEGTPRTASFQEALS